MANTEKSWLKEIWQDKKKRSRLYYVIFFTILGILFIVNNLSSEEGEGPLPPDYWQLKRSSNEVAADFQLKSVKGEEISLNDQKGKIVILDFWATWCKSCQKMTGDLIDLKEKYKQYDFEIISVSMDTLSGHSIEEIKKYAESKSINYPVLIGDKETSSKYGNIEELPVLYVIKKDGTVYRKYKGWTPKSLLDRDITLLLQ